ncbi:MAG: hypothetical protein L3J32_01580 [Rhizobiaceae bacterium]|nr:hypothetical protein [Rhizobiaceae bacterium]
MKSSSQPHQQSCPNCEFTDGNPGKPHSCDDGSMVCAKCNTRWRNIAKTARQQSTPLKTGYSADPISLPSAISANIERTPSRRSAALIAGAAVFLGILAVPVFTFFQSSHFTQSDKIVRNELTLGEISIENIQNSNTPVWVISGLVSNNSANLLNVPSILMRAGTKGSSGYFTWTYHPALQILAPGSNFRFRTSVRKPLGNAEGIELEFIRSNLESG